METLIVLLILALSEKDPKLKETLKNVLSFYRENRELLIALSSPEKSAQGKSPASSEDSSPSASRAPSASEDGVKILEAFLKQKA